MEAREHKPNHGGATQNMGVLVMFRGRVVGEMARGWDDRRMVAAMEGLSS